MQHNVACNASDIHNTSTLCTHFIILYLISDVGVAAVVARDVWHIKFIEMAFYSILL